MSQKKSVWQNHTFVLAVLSVVIALGFIVAITPTVQSISTVGMTGTELDFVQTMQLLTSVGPIAIAAAFSWSLFGYLREKAGDVEVNYDLSRLAQTVAWFVGIATPIAYCLNAINLNGIAIGTAIAQIFMTIKAVINQVQTAMQQQPAPAPSPPK